MSLYLGTNCISAGGSSAFKNNNIGEIIQSTIPLTDAGLHLLDGSVISGSGSYSAFVTHIAGLVSGHSELFTTEANWQTSVTNYGVCGKFVYDSVNNTIRLPKITGFIEGTIDPTVLGDLTEAGLPNITGRFGAWESNNSHKIADEGPFTTTSTSGGEQNGNGTWNTTTMNLSRANPIYGNSSTVQPQSIKVLYYIVIATSTKTSIEVDIDEIATDLNGKADVDLSNCTKPHIVETWHSGTSWYRIYSDGWCEQGDKFDAANIATTYTYNINLFKPYKDTNYSILTCGYSNHADQFKNGVAPYSFTKNSFVIQTHTNDALQPIVWCACGYIS